MRRRDISEDIPKNWNEDDEPQNIMIRSRNSIHSVPFFVGIIILIYFSFLTGFVYYIDNSLPQTINVADEKSNPDAFIAERAMHDLEFLTNLGPKVVGSYENEVLAVDFLKREIQQIIINAHPNQKVELDVQVVSGFYYVNIWNTGNINTYTKVQNVIVKLYGSDDSEASLLINSHFDSVPTSPGGSDDGINVVTMLEVMRKLSRQPQRSRHNVIFLFNGAEETVLQASHGFITQHKWAKECKVFLNLEAAGAGGKIVLFQTGPGAPWLLQAYKQVPHPAGRVAGEEIFQTGLIPSDTDFRIFRDYGEIVGMDMAFYKYGYRYHTKYDDFKNIPPGSFQHVGDNTLELVKFLSNAPELNQTLQTGGKVVYYDVLGWFFVFYSLSSATIINSSVIFVSIFVFVWSILDFKLGLFKSTKYLAILWSAIVGGWLVSLIFVVLLSLLLDSCNRTMSWYGSPQLVAGLYSIPTIAIMTHILSIVNYEKLSLNIRLQIQAHVVRLSWTVVLLIGTILQIRTMYIFSILVAFSALPFLVVHSLRWHHSIRKWQVVYLISMLIPTVLLIYEAQIALGMFIPLTGRIGSNKNPDLIIGCMVSFFTIIITSPYVALSNILRKGKYFLIFLWIFFVGTFIIVFTPLGFPYRGDWTNPTPQRHWMTHTQRIIHNETGHLIKTEGGIFMLNMDRNSPNSIRSYVKDLSKEKSLKDDCEKYVLCGLPLSHVKMASIVQYSTWIPANLPVLPFTSKFVVNSKEPISSTIIRYNISASGPDRQYIFLVPKEGMNLVKFNMFDELPSHVDSYKGRPLVFVSAVSGVNPSTLTFGVDIEVPANYTGSTMDVAISSIHLHSKLVVKTPFYIKFLQQFPDWADVTAWVGSYESYVV